VGGKPFLWLIRPFLPAEKHPAGASPLPLISLLLADFNLKQSSAANQRSV